MLNRNHDKRKSVIIILHEIYGLNPHMEWVCNQYTKAGFDVFCPDFLKSKGYFPYNRENEAYQYFRKHIGFPFMAEKIKDIIKQAKKTYEYVFLLGFSAGATVAWMCSELGNPVDGVICYYGTRIRDYLHIEPKCPTLLLFAEEEKSFDVSTLISTLSPKRLVSIHLFKGKHGFSDPYSENYNPLLQESAQDVVDGFIAERYLFRGTFL